MNMKSSNVSSKHSDRSTGLEIIVTSAVKIQRAWRRYIDIQVFKYYKDLVTFHNEGDPALIMRYINPIEAKLIDSASGIHIRFRLAGQQFPPTIFYKIYTHRPVQDICANAPRDYTKPSEKLKIAEMTNNRNIRIFLNDSLEGWYKRVENNGWRPVSNKHLVQMNIDYYYGVEKNFHKIVFHHSKMKRREDIELKKKKKKIEWMKKMYQNGDTNDANVNLNEQGNSRNIREDMDEWEIDEMLEWTKALNFDDYYNTWQTIGTTKKS